MKPNTLYTFQQRVNVCALQGEDILLQAPTGAGKTNAAMLPGLKGFEHEVSVYPQQMIYGIPMRALANSFLQTYQKSAYENAKWRNQEWKPTIQTGESPEDVFFTGRIIFATVDQILASFLGIPYSIPRKLDNINTGAFIGSYLIFDEFHLYPSKQMMLTVMAMLKMLKGISRFTLMTATFSRNLLDALADNLGATIIADEPNTPVSDGLFADIPHLQNQDRIWSAHQEPLNGQHIHRLLQEHETILCVCNTVDRAQVIYEQLHRLGLPKDTDCLLLHSRFYSQDRRKKEQLALNWMGKDEEYNYGPRDGRRKVIIATQVVEVGLDISAEVLLTECAPGASLIQRAGRCARGGGVGYIHVHQPPTDENGLPNYVPYIDDGLLDVCERTWEALNTAEFGNGNGIILRYDGEQRLIDLAHSAHDEEQIIDGLSKKIDERCNEIIQCMRDHAPGYANTLIRENTNAKLYIKADRESKDLTEHHTQLEGFSVSQGRIAREFENMLSLDSEAPFLIATGREISTEADSEDLQTKTLYTWHPLREKNDVWNNWLFLAHPLAVTYDANYGLRWQSSSAPATESPKSARQNYHPEGIDPDTYVQHVGGLMQAYQRQHSARGYLQSLRDNHRYGLMQAAKAAGLNLSWDTIDRYLRLTIALHDLGKLNKTWQNWALSRHLLFVELYPDAGEMVPADGTPLAHTVLGNQKFPTPADAKAFEEAAWHHYKGKRGPHAVESAEAARNLILKVTDSDFTWYGIISTAICHHHTSTANSIRSPFSLCANGLETITAGLQECGFTDQESEEWAKHIQPNFRRASNALSQCITQTLPQRSDYFTSFLYYLFVRVLRLADQRSSHYVQSQ